MIPLFNMGIDLMPGMATMSQLQFPFFPEGSTNISAVLAFEKREGRVTYFTGGLPLFVHDEKDLASFRMITAQFCINGHTSQAEISRVFGVATITVKRSVKLYREAGAPGFYTRKKTRGAAVLTPEVLREAQQLFDEGVAIADVADKLGLLRDTLAKAGRAGRLHIPPKKESAGTGMVSTKSARTSQDSLAPMGVGASNVPARLAASVGLLGAVSPQFQMAVDVPHGGVLMALPALLAVGLLDDADKLLTMPKGYYGIDHILLLLAFMALARIESIESLRNSPPGEWGKLLGLDRIPEVRTLREKVAVLSGDGKAEAWGAALCEGWMKDMPDAAGTLYVDGHMRVYHGSQTKLPYHYIARQKLCLRASADYWVNAADGQPFFVVNCVVDPGLIKVIEEDILPRLEKDVPVQADEAMLAADPLLHRFTMVFDREGYSPDFFLRLKMKRIACLTYNKYPGPDWSVDEFSPHKVTLSNGQVVEMQLAERGVCLSNKLWVREIRKLTETGHQTPVLATDYRSDMTVIAPSMFARWSQENFFKYGRKHFALDRLIDYGTEEITDPILVVNPDYRKLDGQVRSTNGKLSRARAAFGALSCLKTIEAEQMEPYILEKATLQEKIEGLQKVLADLKKTRKDTARHIKVQDLPEEARFRQLSTHGKQFIDTIKMAAYRAEVAMANCLREFMPRANETHTLLRALYESEADLIPDYSQQTLMVCLHHSARHNSDREIIALCQELNATETKFPRTDLRMIFKLGAEQNP
jgi:hypothetical protein